MSAEYLDLRRSPARSGRHPWRYKLAVPVRLDALIAEHGQSRLGGASTQLTGAPPATDGNDNWSAAWSTSPFIKMKVLAS